MLDYLNEMNTKQKLDDYINFIKNFENSVKKNFEISSSENIWSYMIDQNINNGIVDSYNFTLHGSGFLVKKDIIVCEYDKAPLNEYEIKFSFWKFKNFIESNYPKIDINDNVLKEELSNLIDENILNWLIIDGINWNVYQARFY